MQQPSSTASSIRQQFIPLLPDAYNNRARQHSAPSLSQSIWAPQPQSPGGTWPKSIFSYNDNVGLVDLQGSQAPSTMPLAENRQPLTKEDVFGTLSGTSAPVPNRREVGAIGEGRQRDDQPQDADVSIRTIVTIVHHSIFRVILPHICTVSPASIITDLRLPVAC